MEDDDDDDEPGLSYLQKDLGVSLSTVVPSHCILELLVILLK